MIINFVLLATVAVLIATGVYLFLDRALTKMLMGALLMGNGINLLILIGGGGPGAPPIWGRDSIPYAEDADPLPQAFILTAIVWFGFEKRRFQGPPLGEVIAARQAAIRAAEQAVGEGH